MAENTITLPLAIRREWKLYAFEVGHEVTDLAGHELGKDDLAQIIDGATRSLQALLEDVAAREQDASRALRAAEERYAELQEANDTLKRDLLAARANSK